MKIYFEKLMHTRDTLEIKGLRIKTSISAMLDESIY
jgi:hypothetical protein